MIKILAGYQTIIAHAVISDTSDEPKYLRYFCLILSKTGLLTQVTVHWNGDRRLLAATFMLFYCVSLLLLFILMIILLLQLSVSTPVTGTIAHLHSIKMLPVFQLFYSDFSRCNNTVYGFTINYADRYAPRRLEQDAGRAGTDSCPS